MKSGKRTGNSAANRGSKRAGNSAVSTASSTASHGAGSAAGAGANSPDLAALIRTRADGLPQAQQQVAALFLDDPEGALRLSVAALAGRARVSPPTIVRFCRALGFGGLREFKLRLAQSLPHGTPYLHRAVSAEDGMADVVHKVLYGAAGALTDLERHVDPVALECAIARLAKAPRVDCYGVGNTSAFIAADAQARFFRLGYASNAYHDAHFQLISAASLGRGDVALAISYIGRMGTLLEAVDVARGQGATIIAITMPGTPLAKMAEFVLPVVVPSDPAMRVGTEAYLAQMAWIEILMVGVALRRGAGALARLKRVREVLAERGVDHASHPGLQWAWSKNKERKT